MDQDHAKGQRILIVEDEFLAALLIQDVLEELGYRVVAHVTRTSDALEVVRSEALDAAILDVNLADGPSYPVAEELQNQGVPFFFLTAVHRSKIPEKFNRTPVLEKPFRQHEIERTLTAILSTWDASS